MYSSSLLKLVVSAGLAGAMVLGLYACSSSASDAGGTLLPDGAIVETDAPSVTDPDAIAPADSPAPDTAPTSLVNVTTATVQVATGEMRTYVLSVPKTYDTSKSYPLIIALAGDGETADSFRQYVGLDAISGNDAITAYPDSVDNLFDDYSINGDQQLVFATIDDVKSKYSIDATKIWGFGYSKGGYMLNQLQCLKPGAFNAITAHATGGPAADAAGDPATCMPESTTAILDAMGDQDSTGAEGAAEYWAAQNGCQMTSHTVTPSACVAYDGCPAGKQVQFCLAPGVSHFPIWNQATTVSWAFFKSL